MPPPTTGLGHGSFGMPWPTVIKAMEGSMETVKSGLAETVKSGLAGTALNTGLFLEVYKAIFNRGTYRKHDLVVKLDPDTVFSARRLKRLFGDVDASRPTLFQNSRYIMSHYTKDGAALHGELDPLRDPISVRF